MAKVEKIETKLELFTPIVEFEYFKYIEADKFGKFSVNLLFNEQDVAKFNQDVVAAAQTVCQQLVTKLKADAFTVKLKKNYVKEHTKWDKATKQEVVTGRGNIMLKLNWDAHNKDGSDKPKVSVFGVEKGEDGKFKRITSKVGNGSRGKMKFTVNLCGERVIDEDENGKQTTYVKAFASIKPIAFQITELREFQESTPIDKYDHDSGF